MTIEQEGSQTNEVGDHSEERISANAVCIGISQFGPKPLYNEEPAANALPALDYAQTLTEKLADALEKLGFNCRVHSEQDLPTAEALGALVATRLAGDKSPSVQVIHVLSHGHSHESGVHVVGADGKWTPSTLVNSWISAIEGGYDRERLPHTLFVIDTCFAGKAARLDWLKSATAETKAWVIAATEPDRLAFNGRLTQALTTVLDRIQSGELDFTPSKYVPFVHLVDHVGREVARLGGETQYVTGTPSDRPIAPPLIPNPRFASADTEQHPPAAIDPLTGPFEDLDAALDPGHFLDRASGRRADIVTEPNGFFTGRHQQLAHLASSLSPSTHPGGLTVVTGGPGSGKSALLGVLVCALHPKLRDRTRQLWRGAAVPEQAWSGPMAAVHLRERSLSEAVAALIRQLHLTLPSTSPPDEVVAAIRQLPSPPLLIFDALDEANGQDAVDRRLLQPLANATRPDGRASCTVWVGTRPWRQFGDLLAEAGARGGLLDLDAVPQEQLRAELGGYVDGLLSQTGKYRDRAYILARRTLSQGVADALTAANRQRGGEFLIASLYTHWLLRRVSQRSAETPTSLLERVPQDIPEMLDLDMATRDDSTWLLAVLKTLAIAHGAGMPATVIRRCAPALYGGGMKAEVEVEEFDRLLREVRFYLRSTPETDGTTLYRLFHQSLNDHLADADTDLTEFVSSLMAPVPRSQDGRPRLQAAEPYVRRHWVQHAADAGRLDLLASLHPAEVEPALDSASARSRQGRQGAAIYRQSARLHPLTDVTTRRQLLTIDAARFQARRTSERLWEDLPSPLLRPAWSTGGAVAPWLRTALQRQAGHVGFVSSAAVMQFEGRTAVVSGGEDGTVRVWEAATGASVGPPLTGHRGPVASIAGVQLNSRTVVVARDRTGTVWIWDAATDVSVGKTLTSQTEPASSVTVGEWDGRAVVVAGSGDGTVRLWDAASGAPIGRAMTGHTGRVSSVVLGELDGRTVVVSGSEDRTLRVWDVATGAQVGKPLTGDTSVFSVAIGRSAERTLVVSGSGDGTVQLWDAGAGVSVGTPLAGHTRRVSAAAVGELGGRTVVVTGSGDRTVRVWDAGTGTPVCKSRSSHTGLVSSVAIGEIGGRTVVISGSEDGSVRVWDATTGAPVGDPLTDPPRAVLSVAVGKLSGRTLVAYGSADGTVRVWVAASGAPVGKPLVGHSGSVSAVGVGALDERTVVVSGGADRTVRVWDAATGDLIGEPLTGNSHAVSAVAVGELDGRAVVISVGAAGAVCAWDIATGSLVTSQLSGHTGVVSSIAIGRAGERTVVVYGSDDGTVRMWDVASRVPVGMQLAGHIGPVSAVALGRLDGHAVLVSGGWDRTIRIWDAATSVPLAAQTAGHIRVVSSVAVGQIGGRSVVASGSHDGSIRVWDAATGGVWEAAGASVSALISRTSAVSSVAVGELDGSPVVVSGSHDGSVRLWEMPTTNPLGEAVTGHTRRVSSVAVGRLRGRTVIVSGAGDGTVRLWDATTGASVREPLTGHTQPVTTTAMGQLDGRVVVISSEDETVMVWDATTGVQAGYRLTGQTESVSCVAAGQPDGRIVAVSGSQDGMVLIWNLGPRVRFGKRRSIAPTHKLKEAHTRPVSSVAVGQCDGRSVVISGSADRTVRVWDAATGHSIGEPLAGNTHAVTAVAVGELDGRAVVISGSEDGQVRVWDVATGVPVGAPLIGHTALVSSVTMGELDGGTVIFSGSWDGTVRVWRISFGVPLHGRPIADDEALPMSSQSLDSGHRVVSSVPGSADTSTLSEVDPNPTPLTWQLPYRIGAVAPIPGGGCAVAFGIEVAVFSEPG